MRFYQPVSIERFVDYVIHADKDALRITANYEIEKEEISVIIADHFKELGIFMVLPHAFARIIRDHLLFSLLYSPAITGRRSAIRKQMDKAREKNRRLV